MEPHVWIKLYGKNWCPLCATFEAPGLPTGCPGFPGEPLPLPVVERCP